MKRLARCPRCRSTRLSLIEVVESVGETDFGEVYAEGGYVIIPSPFYWEPGAITNQSIECGECRHRWTSRRTFQGA